jgi:hypothetical protein
MDTPSLLVKGLNFRYVFEVLGSKLGLIAGYTEGFLHGFTESLKTNVEMAPSYFLFIICQSCHSTVDTAGVVIGATNKLVHPSIRPSMALQPLWTLTAFPVS